MASEETIKLRKRLLSSVDGIPRSAGQIADLLQKGGLRVSAAKVGNNLRYLEKEGYVSCVCTTMGKRMWTRLDKADDYKAAPTASLFVEISPKLNDELDRVAKTLKISKSQLVRDALIEQLGICM